MRAPLGAPMAILLSGLLGFYSERVRESEPGTRPRVFDLPAGRALAAVIGAGLLGTAGEAGLLHFRGAFHNPFMFAAGDAAAYRSAALAGAAAAGPAQIGIAFTRWWLRLPSCWALPALDSTPSAYPRNMGGWRNWSQNILNGPPLPAPPSFTGLALAGLAALGLMEDHPDA